MPTVHEKLKLAFVHTHPDDGLMLTVTTARGDQKFDMTLSPQAAAMLLGQLTQGVKDSLVKLERLP
ncbi:MAG: hypothetical protein ABFD96_25055 [Armatimonadia bacterium]